MNDVFAEFLKNLQSLKATYQALLDVAREKKEHILRNNMDALRDDVHREEALSAQGSELNARRESLHNQCRAQLKVKQGAETLGELCRLMPKGWAARFAAERDALKKVADELQEANRMNVALVNSSLEMMNGLLSALFQSEPITAYSPRGIRSTPQAVTGSLNAKA